MQGAPDDERTAPRWGTTANHPSQQESILKPAGWMNYRYPFIYGQPDARQFLLTTGVRRPTGCTAACAIRHWVVDHIDRDVPMLIEQIRTRVLPKRGIVAARMDPDYARLAERALPAHPPADVVQNPGRRGIPCFREAINTFLLADADIVPHPVDEEGIVLDDAPAITTTSPRPPVPTGWR